MYPNLAPGLVPHLVCTWWHLVVPGGVWSCWHVLLSGRHSRQGTGPISTPIQIPHLQIISKLSPTPCQLLSKLGGPCGAQSEDSRSRRRNLIRTCLIPQPRSNSFRRICTSSPRFLLLKRECHSPSAAFMTV
jgi:hypothetical protein